MLCKHCGAATSVVDSRPSGRYGAVRRRRKCETCHSKFVTYELTEEEIKGQVWWEQLRQIEDDLDRIKRRLNAIRKDSEIDTLPLTRNERHSVDGGGESAKNKI